MELDSLRTRLAHLGVDVQPTSRNYPATADRSSKARGGDSLIQDQDRVCEDVMDVLQRCHQVDVAHSAPNIPSAHPGDRNNKGAKDSRREEDKEKTALSKPPKYRIRRSVLHTGQRMKSKAVHTPLGSVLAQYREAEEQWTREKAALRRDAFAHRRRANKFEIEVKKFQSMLQHKTMDVKALKTALANRDSQLVELHKRISELEQGQTKVQEEAAHQVSDLATERDELRTLLAAMLKRLECVDEFVHRTAASSSVMEDRVRAIEQERLRAVAEASKASGLEQELLGAKTQLHLQKKMLKKVSDIHLKKNREQKKAIRDALEGSHPNPLDLAPCLSDGDNCDRLEADDYEESLARDLRGDIPPSIQSILGR
ncbi:unnamed protein product [Ostreobium quekettii]|uniref:Uncharacterized protein n=1 Tax=Ostreobium quekettii TaxID=121088 RepID=A0A8S1J5H5_9CHLO|nr:unnamed protein product [Ostreobium quekettii]|eukprot:evm.model.scf_198.2 EVM.evm.TU.scf_198.2   scf_198:22468-27479(+)